MNRLNTIGSKSQSKKTGVKDLGGRDQVAAQPVRLASRNHRLIGPTGVQESDGHCKISTQMKASSKRSGRKATSRKKGVKRAARLGTLSRSKTGVLSERSYRCDACGYVYTAGSNGNPAPEDQKTGWSCPECSADADHFQIIVPSDALDGDQDEDELDLSLALIGGRRLTSIKNKNPDVANLFKRWKRGDLDLQPKFQRYDVWSDKIRSALVESILLELPIPTIYLAENEDGRFVVVDGQQRLTAIFRFLDNGYALTGLKTLASLNTSHFSDLSQMLKTRIEDRALDITEIYKETDATVRFSLFERLNRGSVKLNDQELRNCVYRGSYNDFVNRLAESPLLARALNLPKGRRHQRMVDAELVLRFLAFYEQTYTKHPDKRTAAFLNRQMDLGNSNIYSEHDIAKQEFAFTTSLKLAATVFGNNAFRRFRAGSAEDPNGSWEPRLNRALMDVTLNFFARYDKATITANADSLREAAVQLMANETFVDLITHTISSADRVRRRFEMFETALRHCLSSNTVDNKRVFRASDKEALYKTDPTCSICRNKIMIIDDAHVDHLTPHSLGGSTSIKNAQLTHQFCNQSAGDKRAGRVKRKSLQKQTAYQRKQKKT